MTTPARKLALLPMPLAALVVVASAACDSGSSSPENKTCENTAALTATTLRGTSMQAKQIALTFDDGPGDRTSELSQYLHDEGIQAVFFVNGMMMGPGSDIVLDKIVGDGHLVANHTETHASLTGRASGTAAPPAATIVSEIEQTDAKIAPYVKDGHWLFRPPFGDWDDAAEAAVASTPVNKYVGPIGWDIGDRMGVGRAADWDCWVPGSDNLVMTTAQCGDLYLAEAKSEGKGIILMHDPYGDQAGNTVDMVKYLVPKLREEGFTFVRADRIPEIAVLLPPDPSAAPDGGSSSGGDNATPPSSMPPSDPTTTPPPAVDPCASAAPGAGVSQPASYDDGNHGESGHLAKR